jgi:hypothetical protein
MIVMYESYLERNIRGELLTKQSMRGTNYYIKYTYKLKLLLNVVTARTEAVVVTGSKFLYACVKEVCRL